MPGRGISNWRAPTLWICFDFAPVTYVMLDGIGMVLEVNLAATRLIGVERDGGR